MAFPVVQTKTGGGSAGSTSHPVTLPSGVTAGDLLVVWFGFRSNPTATGSAGWTKLGQASLSTTISFAVFYKVATGSDALTITTTTSQRSTHESYRITGASGTVAFSAASSAVAANPNPPSLTPAGGAKDYLWFASATATAGTTSASAAPTNYTNLTNQVSGSGTGCAVYIAERNLNATSEDPGAFTAASTSYVAYTLAVEPAGSGGTAYTLTADAGSYILSGQTVNLTSARSIVAAPGSCALTGNDATLVYTGAGIAYSIAAEAGSYSLTGQVANLTSARRILADPGSYSLTGQAANLTSARRITADPGSYSLTGQAANLNIGRRMAADPGSYVLTGNTANFPRLRNMIAVAGSYSLTGQAANLSLGRRLFADSGSYVLNGNAANFSRSIRIETEAGSYVLMGQDVGLNYIPTAGPQVVTFIIG